MSGKTLIFPVTSAAPQPIVAQTICKEVEVGEDQSVPGFPTVDYVIRMPTAVDDPLTLLKGQRFLFTPTGSPLGKNTLHYGYYVPGDIIGYIETVSGSSDFAQDE